MVDKGTEWQVDETRLVGPNSFMAISRLLLVLQTPMTCTIKPFVTYHSLLSHHQLDCAQSRLLPITFVANPHSRSTDFDDHHGHELQAIPLGRAHLWMLDMQDPSRDHPFNDV